MHFSGLGATVAEIAICLCWRSIALAAEYINLIVTQGFRKPDDNGFGNVDKLCVTVSGWPCCLRYVTPGSTPGLPGVISDIGKYLCGGDELSVLEVC